MQNKDKGDGIEDSPLDMLLLILLEGASKEVVTPSSKTLPTKTLGPIITKLWGLGLAQAHLWPNKKPITCRGQT